MRSPTLLFLAAVLVTPIALSACATDLSTDDDPGGPPAQLAFGGKADGFSIPKKAYLPLEKSETLTIDYSDDAGNPADFVYAEFRLSGRATARFTARGADTELYIYKQLDASWWTQVTRHHSSLSAVLDKGPYRLLLRRRHPADADDAQVELGTGCTGDGCTVYTAFPLGTPQVVNVSGGPVLAQPRLIPVTFDGEPLRADLEDYLATIGSSDYWRQTATEYGVAPATAGTPVHLSHAAPASLTKLEMRAWIASQLDGTHPAWDAPDAHSFYVVYFPATTSLDLDGKKGCTGFGGYHDSATLSDGTTVVYAAMPRCDQFNGLEGLDALTMATSHELLEGVTDPIDSKPAYGLPDDDHFSWGIESGGEVGDMCAFVPGANTRVPGLPYTVQRSWSNRAAAAGQDPCVPHVASAPFVVAEPVLEQVSVLGNPSLGVNVPVGQSRTIEVDLSSAGPTDKPIQLKAIDGNQVLGGEAHLELSWDRDAGSNGDRAHLTIHTTSADSRGFSTFIIAAKTDATNASLWHGFVTY